jgi:enoyl-CoA hydratase/carnithine racemase
MSDELIYNVTENIGHIVLNRPQRRNALTCDMYKRIGEICAAAGSGEDPNRVKIIIISGSGDAAFASGTDISQFNDFASGQDGIGYENMLEAIMCQIENCKVPTISALHGFVTGGGLGIAAACDIRLGSADLRLGVPIARTLGNCLALGTLRRFVALVGEARTKYILLTAELIDAKEAQSAGFISEILTDKAAAIDRALELAEKMTAFAPLTMKVTKTALQRLQTTAELPNDDDLIALAYDSKDFREGRTAFFEKRAPNWTGT